MRIIEDLLNPQDLRELQSLLQRADWQDGAATAGTQSAQAKRNQQLAEDSPKARSAQKLVLQALSLSAPFLQAALPKRIYPPLFNRYAGQSNHFGEHIDNAVRTHAASGQNVRTDLAATLFLSDPASYEGGELIVRHGLGESSVKLEAGSMVLYPAGSLHRVAPVLRGERVACFFWLESMVRSAEQRDVLIQLDESIQGLRQQKPEPPEAVALVGCYHNLLRMWAEAS